MGKNSGIQWTDHTFNPWIGCQKVSPGCKHCYAHDSTFVRVQRQDGRELWGNEKRSERHVTSDANWKKPLRWNREAEAQGRRAKVFCASLADVFEDRPDLEGPRARLWELIEATPALDWQLLTKRPENVLRMVPEEWRGGLPPNVWIGTSVENQEIADERVPELLRIPAAVRFLSCEPLIGPVELRGSWHDWLEGWETEGVHVCGGDPERCAYECPQAQQVRTRSVDWIIVGGESGPDARPCRLEWIRSLVCQGHDAGVPVFTKQLGAEPIGTPPGEQTAIDRLVEESGGWKLCLRDKKGGDPSEWPEDLRVREFPGAVEVRP